LHGTPRRHGSVDEARDWPHHSKARSSGISALDITRNNSLPAMKQP